MAITRIVIGEHSIAVQDLPLQVFADVSRETGVAWPDIWARPVWNADVAIALVKHLAALWGIEAPELTPMTITDVFQGDPDEQATPVGYDGGLPDVMPDGSPLEESEPTTG